MHWPSNQYYLKCVPCMLMNHEGMSYTTFEAANEYRIDELATVRLSPAVWRGVVASAAREFGGRLFSPVIKLSKFVNTF